MNNNIDRKRPARKTPTSRLVYLDLATIMANYRNPQFWGSQWTIFKSSKYEIYWKMTTINLRRNSIESEVHLKNFVLGGKKGTTKKFWTDSNWDFATCRDIPIKHGEYSQEVFSKNLLGACLQLIGRAERSIIMQYAEYLAAEALQNDEKEKLEEIAAEIADKYIMAGGEYSETIKEAFIEKYVDEHSEEYAADVLHNYDHKVLSSLYLMICSWFGDEGRFDLEKIKIGDGAKRHTWTKMFARTKELQTDAWRDAMAEECKALATKS